MHVTIKQLKPSDTSAFIELIRVFQKEFETPGLPIAGEDNLQGLLKQPGFVVFVALLEETVIAGLTAYTLPSYYSSNPELYLYDLAVANPFQRKGVGKKLLNEIQDFCVKNNYGCLFVQAAAAEISAIEFYRSTGGREEKVIHFTYGPGTFPMAE